MNGHIVTEPVSARKAPWLMMEIRCQGEKVIYVAMAEEMDMIAMPQEEHLDSDDETEMMTYDPYISISFDTEAQNVPTESAQLFLYDADTLLHPTHHPVSIWDSEEVLVHQVVSMKKMNEKPGHVRPENGFYEKLNALKFVPQQELVSENRRVGFLRQ
ncbi:hypothetical protein Tco_0592971 [Tanacetum coccineum]